MRRIDLSIDRSGLELLGALEQARNEGRRDLRDEVISLLRHDSAMVREEALSLLLSEWRVSDARIDALEMLRMDPDFGVRTTAAIGLAAVTTSATIWNDSAVLRDLVIDESEDIDVRRSAYESLSLMHGKPVPPLNRSFDPTVDIDRTWMRALFSSTSQ